MKILYICNEYPPVHHGGIGSYTRLIAENMVLNGHDINVIGNGESGLDKSYSETIKGVKIRRIKNKKRNFGKLFNIISLLLSRLFFYVEVKRFAKKVNPDIIETYDWSAPLIFKLKEFKTIIRLHGTNTAFNSCVGIKKSIINNFIEKRAIRNSDFVVSVSEHIASLTRNIFNFDFVHKTIYNGVDINRFNDMGITRDRNLILLVGRMHPNKGFEDLFPALNHVFTANKNVYFEIICTVIEDYKIKLLSLVSEKFHTRIKFLGRVKNEELPGYYNSANLSILPSRAEAFPIIPLESMACGTPVIMADRFSAREIVDDGVDGFLVDTFDKEGFANKILHILENQSKIEEMREAARNKIVRNFSIDKVINDNIDFYKSVIYNR